MPGEETQSRRARNDKCHPPRRQVTPNELPRFQLGANLLVRRVEDTGGRTGWVSSVRTVQEARSLAPSRPHQPQEQAATTVPREASATLEPLAAHTPRLRNCWRLMEVLPDHVSGRGLQYEHLSCDAHCKGGRVPCQSAVTTMPEIPERKVKTVERGEALQHAQHGGWPTPSRSLL